MNVASRQTFNLPKKGESGQKLEERRENKAKLFMISEYGDRKLILVS
jgi:hypothetical protein